jgi:hypothetical protein
MPIQLANNASGTIATAISASDTGLALTTGDGAEFPTLGVGDYFYATLASSGGTFEIVKATARSGDSLTIVRAQEGTTAQSFAAGSRFEVRVTAQSVADIAQLYANDADISLRNDLAAASGSSLVGFQQAGSSAVLRTAQTKLRETVSVKDFGAVGDGVANDTAAIQAAINASERVFFEAGKTYRCDFVSIGSRCIIDFCGATIKRFTYVVNYIFQVTGTHDLCVMKNGTIDCENQIGWRAVGCSASNVKFVVENMKFINNAQGYPILDKDIGNDHVYVARAKEFVATNNTFYFASRQGISITGRVGVVLIDGNTFEKCYLYGVDIEPNTELTHMYESVTVTNNTFKNCGSGDANDYVYIGGGGSFQLLSGNSAVVIAQNFVFSGNTVISGEYDFATRISAAPKLRLAGAQSYIVTENAIENMGVILVGQGIDPLSSDSVVFSNNVIKYTKSVNPAEEFTFILDSLKQATISGNSMKQLLVASEVASVTGNTFTSGLIGVRAYSAVTAISITGNVFANLTTACIDTSLKSSGYLITGNSFENCAAFLQGPVTSSFIANNSDGDTTALNLIGTNSVYSEVTEVSVPDSTPTTVLNIGGKKKSGMIFIHDRGNTRIGSFGSFANYFSNSVDNPALFAVTNSGFNSSALTLSGSDIQFTHAFGATRTVKCTVIYFVNTAP